MKTVYHKCSGKLTKKEVRVLHFLPDKFKLHLSSPKSWLLTLSFKNRRDLIKTKYLNGQ